jgi:hypothetical protein
MVLAKNLGRKKQKKKKIGGRMTFGGHARNLGGAQEIGGRASYLGGAWEIFPHLWMVHKLALWTITTLVFD